MRGRAVTYETTAQRPGGGACRGQPRSRRWRKCWLNRIPDDDDDDGGGDDDGDDGDDDEDDAHIY